MQPQRRRSPQREREEAIKAAYRTVFQTPEGVLVLHDLINRGGLLSTSMVLGESHETAFNEGKRGLLLEILNVLRWTPGRVMALVNEGAIETDEGPLAPDPVDGEFE